MKRNLLYALFAAVLLGTALHYAVNAGATPIDYRVVREMSERFKNQGILTIEGISPSGKQIEPTSRFHGYGTVSIELDLVQPFWPSRERRDRETLHGLSECS